jgi:hypothetical protein
VKAAADLRRVGGLKEQCQRLDQIRPRFFDSGTFTRNIEFRAKGYNPSSSRSMIAVTRRAVFISQVYSL